MKLLICGANGQVGHELCKLSQEKGIEAVCLGKDELDITDEALVENVISYHNPDCIINAAAYTNVDRAESEAEIAYRINRDGVENLALTCKSLDIPLLHISTDYVFSGKKVSPYVESDIPEPETIYGITKLEGEKLLASIWYKHVILRVGWVFGEYGNNFVKSMIRNASTKSEISIVNDQRGAPTSAKFIAKTLFNIAHHRKLGSENLPWGIRHLRSEPEVSWYGFAEQIFNELRNIGVDKIPKILPISTNDYPVLAKRPKYSKLESNISWPDDFESVCDWRVYLRDMLGRVELP